MRLVTCFFATRFRSIHFSRGSKSNFLNPKLVPSLKLTAKMPKHLKMDGWNRIVSFGGPACFQVRLPVSFRGCKSFHQEFQVPKMEVLNLTRLFWGWVFPYISRIHTAYIGGTYLHFRCLKCLVIFSFCETLCFFLTGERCGGVIGMVEPKFQQHKSPGNWVVDDFGWWIFNILQCWSPWPIGSMGLVYLPTWMVDFYGKCR